MGMFNTEQVAKADADPFKLKEGRGVGVVTKSEVKKIKDEYPAWVVKITEKGTIRNGDIMLWLDTAETTEEQSEINNGKIRQLLEKLEIPESRWDEVSDNPEVILNYEVVFNARPWSDGSGRMNVNIIGLAKGSPPPAGLIPNQAESPAPEKFPGF